MDVGSCTALNRASEFLPLSRGLRPGLCCFALSARRKMQSVEIHLSACPLGGILTLPALRVACSLSQANLENFFSFLIVILYHRMTLLILDTNTRSVQNVCGFAE
jgi:hypothetical protein